MILRIWPLWLVLLLLVSSGEPAPAEARPFMPPAPAPAPAAPAPAAPALAADPTSILGVEALGSENNPAKLDQAVALGAKWARFYVNWCGIQATQPITPNCLNCNFSGLDTQIANLRAKGLEPVLVIGRNPLWSYDPPVSGGCPPSVVDGTIVNTDSLPIFFEFMKALAERYNGVQYPDKVARYFEIYNEPDGYFGAPSPPTPVYPPPNYAANAPRNYAELLWRAYNAVKSVNPNNKVIFGGVAHEWWDMSFLPGATAPFDMQFVAEVTNRLKELGGGTGYQFFDLMGVHYYRIHWPNSPNDKLAEMRSRFPGLVGKPVAVTEFGEAWLWEPQNCDYHDPKYSHARASQEIARISIQLMAGSEFGIDYVMSGWFSLDAYQHHGSSDCPATQRFQDLFRSLRLPARVSSPQVLTNWTQYYGLLDANGVPHPTEKSTYTTMLERLGGTTYLKRWTGPAGTDGYVFLAPNGAQRTAVWTIDYNSTAVASFPGSSLRWWDNVGANGQILDGGNGDLNPAPGMIGVWLGPSLLYIETNQSLKLGVPLLCQGCP